MKSHSPGAVFIKRISAEASSSAAVNHPYLAALRDGQLPDIEMAFKDFAFQYRLYSAKFTRYVSAVIDNLTRPEHREILLSNLAEEQGAEIDVDLPPDILESVTGQPHASLFRRFQEALGVDAEYCKTATKCQTGQLWSRQFLQLCEINEYVGIGAIGIGTELVVPVIYKQILGGLQSHSNLTMLDHVFFNLHSECDEEHAAQIALITEDLAIDNQAREQIEYGVRMALNMRVMFWDKMLERALSFPVSSTAPVERMAAVGY